MVSAAAEKITAQWRGSAEGDNPAGPLYTGGEFAEADMVGGSLASGLLTLHSTCCGTHSGTACC
jgi:hypothetical protein